jgi:hypothetical protein
LRISPYIRLFKLNNHLVVFVLSYSATALADVVSAKGKGSVTYVEQQASPDAKAKALQAAQMNAIDFYYAEQGDSETENLDTIRNAIRSNPDRFILDTTVLNEQDDTAAHRYTVTVRVSLNGPNLRSALKASSAVATVPAGQSSQLAFIFLSRQVDTNTTFAARITQRQVVSDQGDAATAAQHTGVEGEAIRKAQVSTSASTNANETHDIQQTKTVETGGASLARSDAKTWKLIPSESLSTAVALVFKTAGYRVAEAQYIEPLSGGKLKVASIEDDYQTGNDLKSATLINVVDGLRTAEVRYFALATLDVGQVGIDPSTGLQRVVVTVNAKVLDVAQRIPESVAVAGPTQYAGVGPTEEEAQTNALKLAAQRVARELTSQLANAGLR